MAIEPEFENLNFPHNGGVNKANEGRERIETTEAKRGNMLTNERI